MLFSLSLQPLTHGALGILDEVLLYCLPLVVLVIILSIASRRARKQTPPARVRRDPATKPIEPYPPATKSP